MDKARARQLYELADRLLKVDVATLSEQQLSEREQMIARLQQEARQGLAEGMDSLTFWKQEAKKAGGAANIDWYAIGVEHGKQGIVMNPPYGVGGKAVALYSKGLDAGQQGLAEGAASQFDTSMHDQIKNATPQQLVKMAQEFAGDWMHYESELKLIQQAQRELQNNVTEADAVDTNNKPHYNIAKLGSTIGVDSRLLRIAIQRGMNGNPTRQDLTTLADAFLSILKNSDDNQIQSLANIIKAGNPREIPQESTAAIAERNAFVDAMRQVKKGDKFTVGGKEFTKTTNHADDDQVDESIDTEAYKRLQRIFDFSNSKVE